MVAAVERYVKVDHAAEWKEWARQIDYMQDILSKVSGVETGYVPKEITNHVPRLWVKWDEKAFNFSREDCFKALQDGDPSIVPLRTPMGVTIVPWMMAPGQEKLVAATFARGAGARPKVCRFAPPAHGHRTRGWIWYGQPD